MAHEVHHYKLITGIAVGCIVLLLVSIFFFTRNGVPETHTVSEQTLTRIVTVTGTVVPVDEVTLAFTSGGRISSLAVSDGQSVSRGALLAQIDGSEIEANVRQAVADKAVAEAELDALIGTGSAQGEIVATKQQAVTTIKQAFSMADNQVQTNVDALFENPQSGRPAVTPAITNYFVRQSLGQERVAIGRLLEDWEVATEMMNADTLTVQTLEDTYAKVVTVQTYFTNLSRALSDAETTNLVTAADISRFRTLVASARTATDEMLQNLASTQDAVQTVIAENPVQAARVQSASASIERFQALLKNYTITAPFNGTVAEVFVTQGEIVAANQPIASMISGDQVELEVFVPEVNIAYLDVGDGAKVMLDAYGDDVRLGATVSFIDTRATEKNGVVTYRTKLVFNDAPQVVRPGMTATIAIETVTTPNVLVIPRAVVKTQRDGTAQVEVWVNGQRETRNLVLGMTDTQGGVMVESGINAGDLVVVSE
jgi:HlyD family secretion protein